MKITCPVCNNIYNLPDHKIPKSQDTATCNKCGGKIIINPPNPGTPEPNRIPKKYPNPPVTQPDASQDTFLSNLIKEWPDLRNLPFGHLDIGSLLSPDKKGKFKTRQNKLKAKILTAVQAVLPKILEQGERVVKIGKGIANYPVEMLLGNGLLTMIYNHYAIAATDKRILLINIDSRMTHPTHYFFQIPYHNIKKANKGGLGSNLILKVHQGKNRTLSYLKPYLLKELLAFIKEKMNQPSPASESQETPASSLCPSCYTPVPSDQNACPKCRSDFKSAKTAALRSLFLPGLGDLYLGHRLLGGLELFGSVIVWLFVLVSLLAGEPESIIVFFLVLLLFNGVDALVTYHMAKKGHMCNEK